MVEKFGITDFFMANTGLLVPYYNPANGVFVGDFSELNAKQFILEFAVQIYDHMRNKHKAKDIEGLFGREFRFLQLMADKLKDRSFILMFGQPNENGVRDFLGGGLKKREN